MKERLRYFWMLLIPLLWSCSHNNGDIGVWFGQYKLEQLDVDGEADEEYGGNIFWSFQNQVMMITEIDSEFDSSNTFCRWEEKDGCLILNFDNTDYSGNDSNYLYTPPEILRFSLTSPNILTIDSSHSGKIILTLTTPAHTLTYHLKKWG